VGFPGESEADFSETLDVCRQIGFSKIHIFPFSARRGTPAAEYPNQVEPEIKGARVEALAAWEVKLREDYYRGLFGKPLRVLIEKIENGIAHGTACRYATCQVPADSATAIGQFVGFIPRGIDRESGCLI
jgi:threonylcarbamoyladenosine tRNA methylthiotransferase MtaB